MAPAAAPGALLDYRIDHDVVGGPPPPPLPYKVDTSRPSLRTNWTRLVPFPQATIASLNTVFTGEVYYRVAALKPVQVGPILEKFLKESQREGFQAEHYEAIRLAAPQSANLTGTPLNMSPLFMSLAWLISAEYPPPRTKWTRRVPHPVLIGHASCLVQVALLRTPAKAPDRRVPARAVIRPGAPSPLPWVDCALLAALTKRPPPPPSPTFPPTARPTVCPLLRGFRV